MSFEQARQALGAGERPAQASPVACPAEKWNQGAWQPVPERMPSEAWQRRASEFLAECRERLSSAEGLDTLERRGLRPDYGASHGLGWNPSDKFEAPKHWDLEPWRNDKGRPGKVALPAGLVISTFRKSRPVAVKVRRVAWSPGDAWAKYHCLRGSGNGALILGKPGLPVAVVEAELDAMLVHQEASDLCAAVALGSAANRPSVEAVAFLNRASVILVSLDYDEAGKRAWPWWQANFPQARLWLVAAGKDPGDMRESGIPVRMWIEAGIAEFSAERGHISQFASGVKLALPEPVSDAQEPSGAVKGSFPSAGEDTEASRVADVARKSRQDAPQGTIRSQDNANIAPGALVRSATSCAAERAYPAGVGDVSGDFRGERHFPSEYNDWCFRLMVAEGVIQ
jgi:hypothetical protein